ncbi:NADPH-dependent ferric siderophore reductase [Pararhizobium capsulatum DSM 1112]|uniref:NADPH-dependent ferric siderophore reductase n=1 Tax=Pararhizobium capsulatum DSM 1112 TaxID=1121113 RepID=A0ABU0BWN9_9HYPH|nr:siderophore-interacting protein [Pararhizobium capsulatum]MDQ0322681.1 NADPH-dependent ferric siderophore reductase [Pararhizobium capsulatum DSM 1112]
MNVMQGSQVDPTGDLPRLERFRHELKRRQLTVVSTERLTPNMIRIALGGEDLADFTSLSAGDHVKIFVPDGVGGTAMRDYTPRHFDTANRTLVLDFAVHDAGPATRWALDARVGDEIQIGGPRGSLVISGPIRSWLLIGDETALPSIGRRIEEMAAGTPVTSLVGIPGVEDEQVFDTKADVTSHWVHRKDPSDAAVFIERLRDIAIEPRTFVWVAAEGAVTRAIRSYLVEERKHPLAWLRAAGYWVSGKADTTEKFED